MHKLVFLLFFYYNLSMKSIRELKINNNKVILRLDLNVPIKDNKVLDSTKIKESLETINYLLNKNCHILIMSHLGKVKTEDDKLKYSLKPVYKELEKLLGIKISFIDESKGENLEKSFNSNKITLMENTRFLDIPNNSESSCDLELAKYWASLADIFINDAFGTTHRKHASNYGISKYLTSGYGFLIERELKGLSPIIDNVSKPFVVIMGGAKVDDKIKLIESMLSICDYLLVGGGIANTFLASLGYNIGSSLVSTDYIDKVKELILKYENKIIIPDDVIVLDNLSVKTKDIDDIGSSCIYDIGNKTINKYSSILNNAKTVFLNGTVGMYEDERFKNGTISLFKCLEELKSTKIAGGGDAVSSVNNLGFIDTFDFLSTGGGATIEYIINKKLKCFEE